MRQFEITYSDGKIYSGKTLSDWNSCPPTRVQNVTVLHDDDSAQERIFGNDYYIFDDDNQIVGTDILIPGSVKEGETLSPDKFVVLRDSVFQGHSKIWDRPDKGRSFAVGVRQGIKVE